MMENSGRKPSDIAMELGIRRNQLYKWKEQMTKKGSVPTAKKSRPKKNNWSLTLFTAVILGMQQEQIMSDTINDKGA